jgi:uncharacterized protein (DUF58 family)
MAMRSPAAARLSGPDDPVRVTVPGLVALAGQAGALRLATGRIRSRNSGDYLSPFRGRGMEFDEARIYEPGDDIRNIDWRVTARTGRAHTKVFREERERPVFLWVDLRTPMFFATRGAFKSVVAARAASLLAWSAQQRGDRVGGLVFSDAAHREIKPRRGKQAVLRLISGLAGHPAWDRPAPEPDPDAGLDAVLRLRRLARPGSLVFLLSDFRGLGDAALAQLGRLSGHAEAALIFVHDPLEASLPPPGRYPVSDGSEELVLDAGDAGLARDYAARFRAREEALSRLARRHRMRFVSCPTDRPVLASLQAGLGGGGR